MEIVVIAVTTVWASVLTIYSVQMYRLFKEIEKSDLSEEQREKIRRAIFKSRYRR
jgi:heme/copper-type cytochrome/quinol oxidase subunit 2